MSSGKKGSGHPAPNPFTQRDINVNEGHSSGMSGATTSASAKKSAKASQPGTTAAGSITSPEKNENTVDTGGEQRPPAAGTTSAATRRAIMPLQDFPYEDPVDLRYPLHFDSSAHILDLDIEDDQDPRHLAMQALQLDFEALLQ